MRIHITGAAGSGTSTLARALADNLGAVALEADDFYWIATDPPFRVRRPAEERRELLLNEMTRVSDAVVAGSVNAWGHAIENGFDFIVFLRVDTATRLERIRQRELRLFGRVNPDFLRWAAQYDEGPPEGRSLARQQTWLAARTCPVLRLDGDLSTSERLTRIQEAMADPLRTCRTAG